MGDNASESLAREPNVQVQGWGLHLEDFRPARFEVERDRLFARRADGGRNAREHGLRGAMNMTRGYQQRARM